MRTHLRDSSIRFKSNDFLVKMMLNRNLIHEETYSMKTGYRVLSCVCHGEERELSHNKHCVEVGDWQTGVVRKRVDCPLKDESLP